MSVMVREAAIKSILIVVPVYNHAATLGQVLRDLIAINLPILVVNDGSQDQIDQVLLEFPHIPVLRHPTNQGKGAALVTAMRYAHSQGYSAVLSFDADGQHLASDVPKLVLAAGQNPSALIIGSRDFSDPSSGDIPNSSRFGRQFSNFWIWVETGYWLPDTQTGLRVYPIDLDIIERIEGRRYSFEIEIITRSIWAGRSTRSVPVKVFYPARDERVSHFKPWLDNARLSGTHTKLCTLRLLALLGLYHPKKKAPQEMPGARPTAIFIATLGTPLAYMLMIFPVLSSFLARHRERAAIVSFYAKVFPQWNFRRRLAGAFSNFWYFGASIIDRLASPGQQLVLAPLQAAMQGQGRFPPKGSILVGAHYGDWFLIAKQAAEFSGETMSLVLNPGATPEFYAHLERRFGGNLQILSVQQDLLGFALAVKDNLEAGGRVCFLFDRAEGKGLAVDFCQAAAWVTRAPFAMAARLQVPVHFVCAYKTGPGARARYQIFAQEIWDGVGSIQERELAERTMRVLEQRVRAAPQHWFNFFPFWQ